jgi:hypothetical protein
MLRFIFSIILFNFLGCQSITSEQNSFEHATEVKDTVENSIVLDTTRQVENDVFYQFIPVTDSTSRIKWGNQKITNISRVIVDNYYLTDKRLYLEWSNDKFIFLGKWGYGDTWVNIILPLQPGEDLRFYQNIMAVEKNRGYVVYEYPEEDSILIAENILTGKQQVVGSNWNTCGSIFYHYCIDSISIKNETLYVEWVPLNEEKKNKKKEIKRVKLNL